MTKSIKVALGTLAALLVFSGTLFLLFRTHNKNEQKKFDLRRSHYELLQPGDRLIMKGWEEISDFPPLSRIKHSKEEAFDVTYDLNEWALRKEAETPDKKSQHLILGGCSFVFGIGIDESETLSSQLRKIHPDYDILNFGHPSGGLHTQIRAVQLVDLKKVVPEEDGTFVFNFVFTHLRRWKALPSYVANANPKKVHYDFHDGRLMRTTLGETEQMKEFLKAKAAGMDFVFQQQQELMKNKITKEDLVGFVSGVVELKKNYLKLYPKGQFVFLVHPLQDFAEVKDPFINKELFELLKKNEIVVKDLRADFIQLAGKDWESYRVKFDHHPNGKLNKYLAEKI